MPHNEVKHPGVVADGDIVHSIAPQPMLTVKVPSSLAVAISELIWATSSNIKPFSIVNGEGPKGTVIGVLEGRRVAALCRKVGELSYRLSASCAPPHPTAAPTVYLSKSYMPRESSVGAVNMPFTIWGHASPLNPVAFDAATAQPRRSSHG